jgi:ribonuclease PH
VEVLTYLKLFSSFLHLVLDPIQSPVIMGTTRRRQTMQLNKGNYTANVRKDATGSFFLTMTMNNNSCCIPGVSSKYYKTRKNAEKAAHRILSKIA